jgi:hypothetical protein
MNKHELIVAAGKFLVMEDDSNPNALREYSYDSLATGGVLVGSRPGFDKQLIMIEYCWPVQVKEELVAILTERRRLKQAYDKSMGLIYELTNKIQRGEVA